MDFGKECSEFPAVLKTPDDRFLEDGAGLVSPESKSVDFLSDFVPLFKMGTPLKIVQTQDDAEVHSFTGEVYLSSRDMLRIVSVRDEILTGAYFVLLHDVSLEGTVSAAGATGEDTGRFKLLHKKIPLLHETSYPVTVHAISMQSLKFMSDQLFENGQKLKLTITSSDGPEIKSALAEVEQAIVFGQEQSSYRCKILDLGADSRKNLLRFLQELCETTLRMF